MAGRFKGFCHFPCFQTLPPSRAPQARGEACVTVFERRSHLGPPAEGRQGPSDDDDGVGDDDNLVDAGVPLGEWTNVEQRTLHCRHCWPVPKMSLL